VSTTAALADAVVTQSHSRDPAVPNRYVQALQPARVIETYSAGVKLALVARGEADLYLNDYDAMHDWDLCAGHILVAEAGGLATTLYGEPLAYGSEDNWHRRGCAGQQRLAAPTGTATAAPVRTSGSPGPSPRGCRPLSLPWPARPLLPFTPPSTSVTVSGAPAGQLEYCLGWQDGFSTPNDRLMRHLRGLLLVGVASSTV